MDINQLKTQIETITADTSLSVNDRITKVLEIHQELPDNESDTTDIDIIIFKSLIHMIKGEDNFSEYTGELLVLYALLSETYLDKKEYRPIKDIADNVLDILRHREATWEEMEEPLVQIMDVLGDTVYNHDLYEMLIHFLFEAYSSGNLDQEMKGWIRKMLKLRILIKDSRPSDYRLDHDLQLALAKIMTSEELLKIILSPEIGARKKDPVEYTREWEDIYYDVEDELDRRFANAPKGRGFCYHFWNAKRELLKEKYDINWRSPSQMNPRIKFD